MNKQKAICILGGMGPQASARFLVDIVDMSAREFGAKDNDDFPEIIVDSVPVADFIADERSKNAVLNTLIDRIRRLEPLAGIFAICCNTAHLMIDDLKKQTDKHFVSIIDEVVGDVKLKRINVVGVLASPTTIKSRLFEDALSKAGIKTVLPGVTELGLLERIIRKVISGKVGQKDKEVLAGLAKGLEKRGAKGIILGCTELPLIFPKSFELPVFRSSEILARALLRRFFRREVR